MTNIVPFSTQAGASGLPESHPTLESLAVGQPDYLAAVEYFEGEADRVITWGVSLTEVVDSFDGTRVYDHNPREFRIVCNSSDAVWMRLRGIARTVLSRSRAQLRSEATTRATEVAALEAAWALSPSGTAA